MGEQSLFRRARRDLPYSQILNGALQDWKLPLDVRGFLACILSLPLDWDFHADWFFKKNGCGKDRGYRILKQLISAGYAQRLANRNADGTIINWSYVFTDTPGDFGRAVDQLPVFQEVDKWPVKRAPRQPPDQLPAQPELAQPELGQPVLAGGTLQKNNFHKPITGTKKSSERSRARRPSQSDFEKSAGDDPMALTPSPAALERGLKHAPGWDRGWLLERFNSMNEDVEVRNVDAAWIGFCKHTGSNPDKPRFKGAGNVVPLNPQPGGTVCVTRLDPQWGSWVEHARKHHPAVAAQMDRSTTFCIYVPAKLPASARDCPLFPTPKAAPIVEAAE